MTRVRVRHDCVGCLTHRRAIYICVCVCVRLSLTLLSMQKINVQAESVSTQHPHCFCLITSYFNLCFFPNAEQRKLKLIWLKFLATVDDIQTTSILHFRDNELNATKQTTVYHLMLHNYAKYTGH